MALNPPKVKFFDGTGSSDAINITTNSYSLFFDGFVDDNVVDIQINVNDSGFSSSPILVDIGIPYDTILNSVNVTVRPFSVPSRLTMPDGLKLEPGVNTILLRAIDIFGNVSPTSKIIVTTVNNIGLYELQSPPTGLSLDRYANRIEIKWSVSEQLPTASTVLPADPPIGYNIYASTSPGGSGSGYVRVNSDMIPYGSPTKTVVEAFEYFSSSFDLKDNGSNDFVISTNTQDSITGQLIEHKSTNIFSLVQTPNFRLSTSISRLVPVKYFYFSHNRDHSIGNKILNADIFGSIQDDSLLYYVVTSIYFDKSTGSLIESRFSSELPGSPLPLDTNVKGIKIRDRRQISEDYIGEIQKASPTLSLIPGSTIREVHIEPFSNEVQKAYFLLDFVHRSKSFQALLQVDDPGMTGYSVPVSSSSYKRNLASALSINDDATVQTLINGSFDSLAKNYGKVRSGSRSASVIQTFYTTTKPVKNLIVSQGAMVSSSTNTQAPRFISNGQAVIYASSAQSFYNSAKKRYEITVEMTADIPGTAGNVPAGTLDVVSSGAYGLKTINETSSDYGVDYQSNLELAESCMRSLVSLDSGTSGGYESIIKSVPGVLSYKVISSGDRFMLRDYDEVRKKHIGGKVDIYVKGVNERTVNEVFAFQFSIAKSVRFDVVDSDNLVFRARDSRLTPSNPISEVLYSQSFNYGVRNHSTFPTSDYDLNGVTIIDYRTIKLNTFVTQPATSIDDFIEGDYRFRSNNKFITSVQPVRRISSVTGEISRVLDPVLGYNLYKLEDPLSNGESTKSSDYIVINQIDNTPSGLSVIVNSEPHVMIGDLEDQLLSVGVNELTIAVFNEDRSIQYLGSESLEPDFLVMSGSQTEPAKIVRTTNSSIKSGQSILVDYEHDENFNVTYVVNDTLQYLQDKIKSSKHVTADVLVKQALDNQLSIQSTVKLKQNANQSYVDNSIRSSYTVLVDSKDIGSPIHQSDVLTKFGSVDGVDFIVQPFTKMTLNDGSLRIRENIQKVYQVVSSLSKYNNKVYIFTQPLPYNTIDGGGVDTTHHGVFRDNILLNKSSSLGTVGDGDNNFWIIGVEGAIIKGFSDDETILKYTSQEHVQSERLKLTSNKVVISSSTDIGDSNFTATYLVFSDVGVKDIELSSLEFLSPGDLTITYKV